MTNSQVAKIKNMSLQGRNCYSMNPIHWYKSANPSAKHRASFYDTTAVSIVEFTPLIHPQLIGFFCLNPFRVISAIRSADVSNFTFTFPSFKKEKRKKTALVRYSWYIKSLHVFNVYNFMVLEIWKHTQ